LAGLRPRKRNIGFSDLRKMGAGFEFLVGEGKPGVRGGVRCERAAVTVDRTIFLQNGGRRSGQQEGTPSKKPGARRRPRRRGGNGPIIGRGGGPWEWFGTNSAWEI